MMQRAIAAAVMVVALACSQSALATPAPEYPSRAAQPGAKGQQVASLPQPDSAPEAEGPTVCQLIDAAAAGNGLPSAFFTRLIWKESSFRTAAVSPVGAQGIAQFMPATAAERGLADPFDPHQAIPASASLLKDLVEQFGNLGLAAAAYNAGARRVADWLAGEGGMPRETRAYVAAVTGEPVEHWRAGKRSAPNYDAKAPCQEVVARLAAPAVLASSVPQPTAAPVVEPQPWGVQLAGSFSEERALSSFRGLQKLHPNVLGGKAPLILHKRNASRGTKPMVNVRIPAPTREAADDLCRRLRSRGGACVVLKN